VGVINTLDETTATVAEANQTETIWRGAAGPVSLPDAPTGTEEPDGCSGTPGATAQKTLSKRWYAIQHEAFNGAYARLTIKALGFRVHWPREIVRAHRHDDMLVPLFRPYMFVEFDRTKAWADIVHAGGVVAILGIREFGAPIAAPVGEVEALIRRAGGHDDGLIDTTDDAKALPFRTADTLEQGEELTFLGEALYGQKVIVHQDRGRTSLDAMMKMFGMERRVRVRRDRLIRTEGDDAAR
jgi:transcription antitermination factor NusG